MARLDGLVQPSTAHGERDMPRVADSCGSDRRHRRNLSSSRQPTLDRSHTPKQRPEGILKGEPAGRVRTGGPSTGSCTAHEPFDEIRAIRMLVVVSEYAKAS
jgi:hypothetical protein